MKENSKKESTKEKRERIISENKCCISCGTKNIRFEEEYTFNIIDLLIYRRLTKRFSCRCRNCFSEWKTEKW